MIAVFCLSMMLLLVPAFRYVMIPPTPTPPTPAEQIDNIVEQFATVMRVIDRFELWDL